LAGKIRIDVRHPDRHRGAVPIGNGGHDQRIAGGGGFSVRQLLAARRHLRENFSA